MENGENQALRVSATTPPGGRVTMKDLPAITDTCGEAWDVAARFASLTTADALRATGDAGPGCEKAPTG